MLEGKEIDLEEWNRRKINRFVGSFRFRELIDWNESIKVINLKIPWEWKIKAYKFIKNVKLKALNLT